MKKFFKSIVIKMLRLESKSILRKYKPKIVGITGSVGKTSTKDMIYSVMAASLYVRRNEKSQNTDFGVPLTIIDRPNSWSSASGWFKTLWEGFLLMLLPAHYPKWLVLEMGADAPGDIGRLARWARPDIAVVTGMGSRTPVHVEFFKSPEHVYREKSELVKNMKDGGVAVLNADDEKTMAMADLARGQKVTYGFAQSATVRATDLHHLYDDDGITPIGTSFRADVAGRSVPVKLLGIVGKGQVYAALGGLAVGQALELNLISSLRAIEYHDFPPGRGRLVPGGNGSTIIDETYNSSPSANKIALESLRELQANKLENVGRKIAVLGNMAELGSYAKEEHEAIGTLAAKVADELYFVGDLMRDAGKAAEAAGFPKDKIYYFSESKQASEHLRELPERGDLILIKGSQSARMERITRTLMAEPDKAETLLVRQEAIWQKM